MGVVKFLETERRLDGNFSDNPHMKQRNNSVPFGEIANNFGITFDSKMEIHEYIVVPVHSISE